MTLAVPSSPTTALAPSDLAAASTESLQGELRALHLSRSASFGLRYDCPSPTGLAAAQSRDQLVAERIRLIRQELASR